MHGEAAPSEICTTLESCPVCGGRNFRKLASPPHPIGESIFRDCLDHVRVCRCECGLELLNPRPATALLDKFYGSRIYDCHQMNRSAAADKKASWLLDLISSQGPYSPQKRFLDFGCGGGYLLRHAQQVGWDATGFDIGEVAIETCRSHQLPVTNSIESLSPGSFDVIVVNHVLEHVEQPASLIRLLRGLLKPNGRLFIEVPNVRSARAQLALPVLSRHAGFDDRHRAFPIHLWYFSRKTLPRLLKANGLDPVLVTTAGMGLEELLIAKETRAAATAAGVPTNGAGSSRRSSSALALIKLKIKTAFLKSGLGENLIVVSRQAPSESAAASGTS